MTRAALSLVPDPDEQAPTSSSSTTTPAARKRTPTKKATTKRASAKGKAQEETARERRNRLARERRAAKKQAETEAAAAKEKAEAAARETPPTLAQAIEDGDYLEILRAQRREAVRDLPHLTGQAKSAMHRQIMLLSKEIAALEAASTEGTDIGDAIDTPDEDFDPEAL